MKFQILETIQKIDRLSFHKNTFASLESDVERYEAYENSYFLVLHDDEVIGYLCYFPVTKDFYNRVLEENRVYDGDIRGLDVRGFQDDGPNYVFVMSVAILPGHRGKGLSKYLAKALEDELSRHEIDDVVSYAVSSSGERFLSGLGLRPFKDMGNDVKLMRRSV